MIKSKKTIFAAALLAVFTLGAGAAEIIKPKIGEPLRDAAVTRGPDGAYYMTGTRATGEYEGKPDFKSNDGVKLWSSSDLKTWKDEGLVVNLNSPKYYQPHQYLNMFWFYPERSLREKSKRSATAPRLQWIDNKPFITLSNGDHGMRWLSATQVAGPYREARHFSKRTRHRDAMSYGPGYGTIFQDKGGSAYLLQGMYLYRLDDKRKDIVPGSGVFLPALIEGYPNAEWCAKQFDMRAASVYRHREQYILTWAAYSDEPGFKRDDTFYAVANKLSGPYSTPQLLIPGGGPAVLFATTDNRLMASCSIANEPTLVPLTISDGELAATRLPALPSVPKVGKPGKISMFDYANSKPAGRFAEVSPESGRHKSVPLFDLPLKHTSICRGPDNIYYLTGTVASQRDEGGKGEKADFQNNDGIYLWKSSDLKTWQSLGKIWDIEKDGSAWAKQYRIPGDNPVRTDFCRGVTAPEIHFVNNTFYIPYSMNGRGAGLLKSQTGKAEGPYVDMGRITAMGESPSLFVENGEARWLWGRGLQMAKLNTGMTAIEGPVIDMFQKFDPVKGMVAYKTIDLWDVTGPHLFTATDKTGKKRYFLSFSTVTQCHGRANRDAAMFWADSIDGPYTGPARMIPNGGQISVATTPDANMYASFYGADPSAVFRDRPGLVPMEWKNVDGYNLPRKVYGDYVTTRGPWHHIVPVLPFPVRDTHVFHAPDGYFYFSGSGTTGPMGENLRYYRAKDINGPWEDLGYFYTMEEMRDDPDWPEIQSDKDLGWNKRKFAWEPSLSYGKGTYWLSCWFGGPAWGKDVVWKKSIGALLKSTSGKPEGPYKFHSEWPHDWQGLFWDNGVAYGKKGYDTAWKFEDDLKKANMEWTDMNGQKVNREGFLKLQSEDGRLLSEDCGYQLQKVGDQYLYNGLDSHSTYDARVYFADDVRGPYKFLGFAPRLGNGCLVRNSDGKWYAAMCQVSVGDHGWNYTQPFVTCETYQQGAPFNYEIKLDLDSPEPSTWPVHDLNHLDQAVYRK